ncbi:MAG: hypothetical protein WC626_02210 [Methanoregula sp.]
MPFFPITANAHWIITQYESVTRQISDVLDHLTEESLPSVAILNITICHSFTGYFCCLFLALLRIGL